MYGRNRRPRGELIVSAPQRIRDAAKGDVLLLSGSILADQVWIEEWLGNRVDAVYSWGSLHLAANATVSPFRDNRYDLVLLSCFEHDAYCNATPLHMVRCALQTIVHLWPDALACFIFMPETRPDRRLERAFGHEYHTFMLDAPQPSRVAYMDASTLDTTLKRYDDKRHMTRAELRRFGRIVQRHLLHISECGIPPPRPNDPMGDTSATLVHRRTGGLRVDGKIMRFADPDGVWRSDDGTPLRIEGRAHETKTMAPPYLLCHRCRSGSVDVTSLFKDDMPPAHVKRSIDRDGGNRVLALGGVRCAPSGRQVEDVVRADAVGLNRTAYQIVPGVDTSLYFDRLKASRLYDSPVTGAISRPRLDAHRDSCTWLWALCRDVIRAHGALADYFGLTWNADDLESCVHNVIAFRQEREADALDWHLDAEDAIALSMYDAGGIDFRCADGSIVQHRVASTGVLASIAPTNVVYHRSVIGNAVPRSVIVIFFKAPHRPGGPWELLPLPEHPTRDRIGAFRASHPTAGAPKLELLAKADTGRFERIHRLLASWLPNEDPTRIASNMQSHAVILLEREDDIVGAEVVRCFHSSERRAVVLQVLYIVSSEGGRGYGSLMHESVRSVVRTMHTDGEIIDFTCADNTRHARQFWKRLGLRPTTRAREVANELDVCARNITPMETSIERSEEPTPS